MSDDVWPVADSKGIIVELDRLGHSEEECEISLQQTIDFFGPNWTWEQVEKHRVQNEKRLARAERQEADLRLVSMLKAAPRIAARKASAKAERARKRREWMDQRHPGWSLPEWRTHTGLAWETLNRYRNGVITSRTAYVQHKLANAEEGVSFPTVRDLDL